MSDDDAIQDADPAVAAQDPNDFEDEPASKLRQAVVIVHGMGEQRPMETLRGFVETVWNEDIDLTQPKRGKRKRDPETGEELSLNKSWIRPDTRTTSHELRLITTPTDIKGRMTDFYELYWSDVTQGTTLQRLRAWFVGLVWRRWSQVPRDVKALFVVFWLGLALFALPAAIAAGLKALDCDAFLGLSAGIWAGIAAVMAALLSGLILPYLGDVAIYVQAFPGTIAKRAEARERGMSLMRGLMNDPRYDRVVLVSHSLGTILAYDLMQLLWNEFAPSPANPRQDKAAIDALKAVGKMALPLDSEKRSAETSSWDDAKTVRVQAIAVAGL